MKLAMSITIVAMMCIILAEMRTVENLEEYSLQDRWSVGHADDVADCGNKAETGLGEKYDKCFESSDCCGIQTCRRYTYQADGSGICFS